MEAPPFGASTPAPCISIPVSTHLSTLRHSLLHSSASLPHAFAMLNPGRGFQVHAPAPRDGDAVLPPLTTAAGRWQRARRPLSNIALSKVAPANVRTEGFRISVQGRLSTTAPFGASAAMLLRFKMEILEAARKADNAIVNVVANETWVELKILVPYDRYRHPNRLADLREQIEAENPGVVVPPPSMKWMGR